MADPPKKPKHKRSRYTADRGIPGAYEGETVTRRRLFEGGALAAGGVASAAFGLPALGFALGPVFEDTSPRIFQDVGKERDFNENSYVSKVITTDPYTGEAGKTTVYVRQGIEDLGEDPQGYVAISTRCVHLGCPVRYFEAARTFICPCHGGVYDFEGKVIGGPPVRPLDRFQTRVANGKVEVGPRFSVTSDLEPVRARDPGEFTGGIWEYLYPPRPSTPSAP